jgi:hypothetical protein
LKYRDADNGLMLTFEFETDQTPTSFAQDNPLSRRARASALARRDDACTAMSDEMIDFFRAAGVVEFENTAPWSLVSVIAKTARAYRP